MCCGAAATDRAIMADEYLEGSDPRNDASPAVLALNSKGAQDVRAPHGNSALFISTPRRKVADMPGADDIFNAGVLSELRHLNLLAKTGVASATPEQGAHILPFAVRAAGFSVTGPGADALTRQELSCAP